MQTAAQLRTPATRALAMVVLTVMLLLAAVSGAVATEGHGGPAPGLEPKEANATDNEFRPVDYEQNFLWGAAIGLGALTIAGAGALGGLYWLLVVRPARESAAAGTE